MVRRAVEMRWWRRAAVATKPKEDRGTNAPATFVMIAFEYKSITNIFVVFNIFVYYTVFEPM